MSGEKVNFEPTGQAGSADKKYQRSTIDFPYGDLDDAVEVAEAIHREYGTECETDQLAAALNQSVKSGAFRQKTATAGTFTITENERGKVRLTDFGRDIVDPDKKRRARAEAFLKVPLYRALYEKHRGRTLPPPAALQREMADLGVATKQTSRARQAFERSAEQAGYFEAGRDRLVRPGNLGDEVPPDDRDSPDNGGNGGDGGDLHPFIQGLLLKLPEPETQWPVSERTKWLETAAQIFGLIYKGADGTLTIEYTESQKTRSEEGERKLDLDG